MVVVKKKKNPIVFWKIEAVVSLDSPSYNKLQSMFFTADILTCHSREKQRGKKTNFIHWHQFYQMCQQDQVSPLK